MKKLHLNQRQEALAIAVIKWDSLNKVNPPAIKWMEIRGDFYWFFFDGGAWMLHKEVFEERANNFPELLKGNDEVKEDSNEVIPIQSDSTDEVYLVAPQQQTCTCKGNQNRGYCKHLFSVNKDKLQSVAKDYGYDVGFLAERKYYFLYFKKYGKMETVLDIRFDVSKKAYWYKINQYFDNPVDCLRAWLQANYKQPKRLSMLIRK